MSSSFLPGSIVSTFLSASPRSLVGFLEGVLGVKYGHLLSLSLSKYPQLPSSTNTSHLQISNIKFNLKIVHNINSSKITFIKFCLKIAVIFISE